LDGIAILQSVVYRTSIVMPFRVFGD